MVLYNKNTTTEKCRHALDIIFSVDTKIKKTPQKEAEYIARYILSIIGVYYVLRCLYAYK